MVNALLCTTAALPLVVALRRVRQPLAQLLLSSSIVGLVYISFRLGRRETQSSTILEDAATSTDTQETTESAERTTCSVGTQVTVTARKQSISTASPLSYIFPLDHRDSSVLDHDDSMAFPDLNGSVLQSSFRTIDPLLRRSSVAAVKKTLNWKCGQLLGSGGNGSVYLAMNLDDGQLMAAKKISFDPLDPLIAAKISQLQSELIILKSLDHENIVKYFFNERVECSMNIFMEFVPGGSLENMLRTFGPLPIPVVVQYARQILEGLWYIHENGVVHRDIKGGNILLTVTGTVKIADFGSAVSIAAGNSRSVTPEVSIGEGSKKPVVNSGCGTPQWMAPEVIRGETMLPAADIWSFGCTVLEMVTGCKPWQHIHTNPYAIMATVADDSRELPLPEHLDRSVAGFISKCLQRDPALRPTAEQLYQDTFLWDDESPGPQDIAVPSPFVSPIADFAVSPQSSYGTPQSRNHTQNPEIVNTFEASPLFQSTANQFEVAQLDAVSTQRRSTSMKDSEEICRAQLRIMEYIREQSQPNLQPLQSAPALVGAVDTDGVPRRRSDGIVHGESAAKKAAGAIPQRTRGTSMITAGSKAQSPPPSVTNMS